MAEPAEHAPGAEVVVLDDADALAREAARRLTAALDEAIEHRGVAHLALTGGSSAVDLYRELASGWRDAVDWTRVHLWWGDERFVPVDHPESNIGLAYATLLEQARHGGMSGMGGQGTDVNAEVLPGLAVRPENVHPLEVDEALSESNPADLVAQRYAESLAEVLPHDADGRAAFDVMLLGVGDDGHILSVFPGSPALDPGAPAVMAVPAPEHIEPHLPRVTLNPRLVATARLVLVMVPGAGKADVVARIFGERPEDPRRLPARLAVRPNAVWLLDRESAARLEGRRRP